MTAAPPHEHSRNQSLCVVIHDVSPRTMAGCERVIAAIEQIAHVPLTLLAAPDYHGLGSTPRYERWLDERHRHGDELSLHGYRHIDDHPCAGLRDMLKRRVYTRGEGEFAALSEDAAMQRIEAGQRWFQSKGWPLQGFVPPAWLLSEGAWGALRKSSFQYASTLNAFHLLPRGPVLKSSPMVYSVSRLWRRKMSLVWNQHMRRYCLGTRGPFIARLELHPWDADYPDIKRSWQAALVALLRQRQPRTTLQAVIAQLKAGSQHDVGH